MNWWTWPFKISGLKYNSDHVLEVMEASCRCGSCVTIGLVMTDPDPDTRPDARSPVISYNHPEEGSWKGLDEPNDYENRHILAETVFSLATLVRDAKAVHTELVESDVDTMSRDDLVSLALRCRLTLKAFKDLKIENTDPKAQKPDG